MNCNEDRGCAIEIRSKSSLMHHGYQLHLPLKTSFHFSAISPEKVIRHTIPIICIFALELLLLSKQVNAAEWQTEPYLNLQETYSDNIVLAPPGNEISDLITEIDPGIILTRTSSDLKLHASYQMQNFIYAKNSAMHSTHHLLDTELNANLIKGSLFLDGRAEISQQNISSLGRLAIDNSSVTNNRTSIGTYSVSPYFKHNFEDLISSELRYTHSAVATTTNGISNLQTNLIHLNLENGPSFKKFGWGVNLNRQINNYRDNTVGFPGSNNYSANLSYQMTPSLRLTATGGYEQYDYQSIVQLPEGPTQTVGFSWIPSQRTNIEASAGRRFFGNTYMLDISQRSARTVWGLVYNEDITTTQSQFIIPASINTSDFLNNLWANTITDDTLRQQTVDTFIQDMGLPNSLASPVNYLTNRVFLQKRIEASAGLIGEKMKTMFTIYGMKRNAQTSANVDSAINAAAKDETKQIGGTALWSMQISSRTSANIDVDASATSRKDYIKSIKIGMIRQLQPKLSCSFEIRRTQRHSSAIYGGYQENAASASFLIKF
jgi:uncharacterized protein (PEP-CTERM system associated)